MDDCVAMLEDSDDDISPTPLKRLKRKMHNIDNVVEDEEFITSLQQSMCSNRPYQYDDTTVHHPGSSSSSTPSLKIKINAGNVNGETNSHPVSSSFSERGAYVPSKKNKNLSTVVVKKTIMKTMSKEDRQIANYRRSLYESSAAKVFSKEKENANDLARLERIPMAQQPPDMVTPLFNYQRQALFWMMRREEDEIPDKHGVNGSILADEMGLGKTVQAISLLVASPVPLSLIVVPASLVDQWKNEISKHVVGGFFYKTALVYSGSRRDEMIQAELQLKCELGDNRPVIVITTKEMLSGGLVKEDAEDGSRIVKNALTEMKWGRVIVDEAHILRNPKSNACHAVCQLDAERILLMTGTPMTNSASDFYALLRMLRHPEYSCRKKWMNDVETPFQRFGTAEYDLAKDTIRHLSQSFILKRIKGQIINGIPVSVLPPATHHLIKLKMEHGSPEELYYRAVGSRVSETFNKMGGERDAMRRYAELLVLLLRLRQAACHPYLIAMSTMYGSKRPIPDHVDWKSLQRSCLNVIDSYKLLLSKKDDDAQVEHEDDDDDDDDGHDEHQIILNLDDEDQEDSVAAVTTSSYSSAINYSFGGTTSTLASNTMMPHSNNNVMSLSNGETNDKLGYLIDIVRDVLQRKDSCDKIVIFSQFTRFMDIIQYHIMETFGRGMSSPRVERIDGATLTSHRGDILSRFKSDDNSRILLLSLKAGGVGLDLSAANHVVIMDPWWNSATELQAQDRVLRIGQTKPVHVYRFIQEGTAEDHVELIKAKKDALIKEVYGDILSASSSTPISSFKDASLTYEDFSSIFRPIVRPNR